MTRKSTTPDCLRLLVNPFRKISPVARCDNPKKYSSRPPPAMGRSSAKSSTSLRNCALKRRSGQAAFSFWSIPCKKSHQPSELCSEKMFRPGRLQLWGDPLRKATPAFGNVPRKNIPARQLSAFGQSSAKSLASVRKCTPKRRSGQTTSGCLSTPIARLPKRPNATT